MSGFALAEYVVPTVGLTKRVEGGILPKDTGEMSSVLGQVKRRAGKVPGPGAYLSHKDWALNRGFIISKTARDKGTRMNKVPAPGQYDCAAVNLTKPRSIGGHLSKGVKRSFLDSAVEKSEKTPAPDKYHPQPLEKHVTSPSLSRVKKTESRVPKKDRAVPGPGHYEPKFSFTEDRPPNYGTAKEASNSFVDRATKLKEKLPAPGHYEVTKLDKVSRGTKWVQMNGLTRGPLMGRY